MKMIAELIDDEFAKARSYLEIDDACWIWALGYDGKLYIKGKYSGRYYSKFYEIEYAGIQVSFEKMKQLVSYFSKYEKLLSLI